MKKIFVAIGGTVVALGSIFLIVYLKSEIDYEKKINSILKGIIKDKTLLAIPTVEPSIEKRTEEEFNFQKFLDSNQLVLGVREGFSKGSPAMSGAAYGTGFLLGNGVIVTANHVAYPYRRIDICFGGCGDEKNWQEVKVLWSLITKDIIFLYLDSAKYQYKKSLVPRLVPAYKVFDSLVGQKENLTLDKVLVGMKCMVGDFSWKVVGELKKYGHDSRPDQFTFQYNIYVKGCSGAPVFTTNGEIIGIFQEFVPGTYLGVATDIDTVMRAFAKFKQLDPQKTLLISPKESLFNFK